MTSETRTPRFTVWSGGKRRLVALLGLLWIGARPALAAQDTPFADARADSLIRAAQVRHRAQGEDLPGYQAEVFTRSVGTVGAARWAPDFTVITHEMLARVHWQRPNDVSIRVQGMRSRSFRLPGVPARNVAGFWTQTFASEPWFAPRFLGDDIELIGVPDTPARHPLAPDGERWYRYTVADSAVLQLAGRTVRAIAIAVRPRTAGPFPLLTGEIWLDRESLDLVRLTGALTGPGLWEDDEDESPVLVGIEIDLEYGLHDARWWLPSRQIVTTHWTYRYLPGAALTGVATTTFTDHLVMADATLVFETATDRRPGRWFTWYCDFADAGPDCGARDLVRSETGADGRWEVVIPPLDSILAYPFDSAFVFHADLADEDAVSERLIAMSTWSAVAPGGRPLLQASDLNPFQAIGFDRVRGVSLGAAVELHMRGSWGLRVAGRGALHGPEWTGSVGLRREDASGRLELMAQRRLRATEPWSPEGGLGPATRALFFGHDDADWFLAEGAAVAWRGYRGSTRGLRLSAGVERQTSVVTASRSVPHDVLLGDGDFQVNPAVATGWVTRVGLEHRSRHVTVGSDMLAGDHGLGGRAWIEVRRDVVRALIGTTGGDVTPQQEFRLGGPATVRGAPYGFRRGRHLWAIQADWPVPVGPFVSIIPFGDVAGTWTRDDPAVGLGIGVADGTGMLRLDLAIGLRPETTTRFDVRLTLR